MIELLVSIFVVTMLSGVLITYNRTGGRLVSVIQEQSKLVATLQRAKTLAIETYIQSPAPCGYGIVFLPPRTYRLFKDVVGAGSDCSGSDFQYSGSAENIQDFQLADGTRFGTVSLNQVLFIPPDPRTRIIPDQNLATINIQLDNGSFIVGVTVNKAGQISVK